MSDYRDPRDPVYRDPAYDALNPQNVQDLRAQSYSPGMAAAWFVGIALFIGIMIYAFGTGDNQQMAGTDTTPQTQTQPATPPAATPPAPAPSPAPATPPANQ